MTIPSIAQGKLEQGIVNRHGNTHFTFRSPFQQRIWGWWPQGDDSTICGDGLPRPQKNRKVPSVSCSWVFGFEEGSIGYPWLCKCSRILAQSRTGWKPESFHPTAGGRVPWQDGKTVWEPGLPALVTSRRQHRPRPAAGAAAAVEDAGGKGEVRQQLMDINGFQPSSSHFVDWMGHKSREEKHEELGGDTLQNMPRPARMFLRCRAT
jgi:hypothetical protein